MYEEGKGARLGEAPEEVDEDRALGPRVEEQVAVGDGEAAVDAVDVVARVEVELDEDGLGPARKPTSRRMFFCTRAC